MPFENNAEAQVDKSQDAKPQDAQKSMAQQAWAPQALESKQAGTPQDAQQQINDGLANGFGNLYGSVMNGARSLAQGAEQTAATVGSAMGAGAEAMAKTAVQDAETVGKTVDQSVKNLAQTADERAEETSKAVEQTTKNLGQDAEVAGKVGQILFNGAKAGAEEFGKSLQENKTVQETERLGKDLGKKIVENGKELVSNPLKYAYDTEVVAPEQFEKGVAEGLVKFGKNAIDGIGSAAEHPKDTLQKMADTARNFNKVVTDVETGNVKGLGDDANNFVNFSTKIADTTLNGADYLVNATPEQQGKVIGEYVAPGMVMAAATDGASTALEGWATAGADTVAATADATAATVDATAATADAAAATADATAAAGDGANLMQGVKNVVAKGFDLRNQVKDFNEDMGSQFTKQVFGEDNEQAIADLHKAVKPAEKALHHDLKGAEKHLKHEAEKAASERAGEEVIGKIVAPAAVATAAESFAPPPVMQDAVSNSYQLPNFEITETPKVATLPDSSNRDTIDTYVPARDNANETIDTYVPGRDDARVETLPLTLDPAKDGHAIANQVQDLTEPVEDTSTDKLLEELKKHQWAQQMIAEINRAQQEKQYVL